MGRVVKRHSPATVSDQSATGAGGSGGVGDLSSMLDFGKASREKSAEMEDQMKRAHAQAVAEYGA